MGTTKSVARGPSRVLRLVLATGVAIGLLAACSVTKELDTAQVEDELSAFMEGKLGTPIEAVSCPDREMKAGDVFECDARFDGQSIRMRITQEDDEGNITFEQAQAVIEVGKLVAFVEEQVEAVIDDEVQADCGPQRLLVRGPGETIDCQATSTSDGTITRATVTVKDADGAVELYLE